MHLAVNILEVRREFGRHGFRPSPVHIDLAVIVHEWLRVHVIGRDDAAGLAAAADNRGVVLTQVLPRSQRMIRHADPGVVSAGAGDELIKLAVLLQDVRRPDIPAKPAVHGPVGQLHLPVHEILGHPDRCASVSARVVLHGGGVNVERAVVIENVRVRKHARQDGIPEMAGCIIDVHRGRGFGGGRSLAGTDLEHIPARRRGRSPRDRLSRPFEHHVARAAGFGPEAFQTICILTADGARQQQFVRQDGVIPQPRAEARRCWGGQSRQEDDEGYGSFHVHFKVCCPR